MCKHNNETKLKISNSLKKIYEDKILQKQLEEKRVCIICGNEFLPKINIHRSGRKRISTAKTCSDECYKLYQQKINKDLNTGGFREGSVKNYKSGWYKGIHCDSSWELAFVIWNIEHNHKIERCKIYRTYIEDDITKKYYPDFLVDNEKIYEIKGIRSKNSELKHKFNNDITFLYKDEMQLYLNYVIEKYGYNFTYLYEIKDKT